MLARFESNTGILVNFHPILLIAWIEESKREGSGHEDIWEINGQDLPNWISNFIGSITPSLKLDWPTSTLWHVLSCYSPEKLPLNVGHNKYKMLDPRVFHSKNAHFILNIITIPLSEGKKKKKKTQRGFSKGKCWGGMMTDSFGARGSFVVLAIVFSGEYRAVPHSLIPLVSCDSVFYDSLTVDTNRSNYVWWCFPSQIGAWFLRTLVLHYNIKWEFRRSHIICFCSIDFRTRNFWICEMNVSKISLIRTKSCVFTYFILIFHLWWSISNMEVAVLWA